MNPDEQEPKNILVEPDNYGDYMKLLKGGVNFHNIYNHFFKKANLFHMMLDELLNSGNNRIHELNQEAIYSMGKVYRGPCYYELIRDKETNKIIDRNFCYSKPEPTKENPNPEFYELEPLINLDPLSKIDNKHPIIEMEIPQPIRFGLYGLSLPIIQKYFKDPITKQPLINSLDEIYNAPLNKKSRYVSKVHFFKLIRINRRQWDKWYPKINPKLHDVIIDMKFGNKSKKTVNDNKVFG